MSNKILVLFAHPAIHKSIVNRRIARIYREFKNVTFRDLYDIYPEFMIDVEREQELLLENDIIIFHHPIYWYSCPPILKQWIDLVLKNGFAYGDGGDALNGKRLLSTVSTGKDLEDYDTSGTHNHRLRHFLLPFEQTAIFCGMNYLPPFVAYSSGNRFDQIRVGEHLHQYRVILTALSDSQFDLSSIESLDYINSDMQLFNFYRELINA